MAVPAILTTRPFAETALKLAERRLAVIPCPGDDGKSPRGAVKGYHLWKKRPGPDLIRRFAADYGEANIGIITSLSDLTIADVDEGGKDAGEIISRAGDTPLITRTPSGGLHLFYRSNGERSANLRPAGLAVDVKGLSAGIIIVPPSFRPSTGVPYRFERGGWDDLDRLEQLSMADNGADAMMLPANLRLAHGARHCRSEPFAISPAAMSGSVLPWGPNRIRNARLALIECRILIEEHRGGSSRGDPSLFRLVERGSD